MLVKTRGNPYPLTSNGDLTNYDGNSKGNVQNRIGFIKTTTLSVHQIKPFCKFLCCPCPNITSAEQEQEQQDGMSGVEL